ncbi:MAG: anaerobic sulfatase maturase [Paludibacteraceae bacterium]
MAKPCGPKCNLRCDYCYYRDGIRSAGISSFGQASGKESEWLSAYIRQYIQLRPLGEEVVFIWHGGEPLLQPVAFYQEAVRLQKQYADGHPISNIIQTNGTLLNEEWCRFFHDEQWMVGVSVDGPKEIHEHYRGACFPQVMKGVELLRKHGTAYTVMGVITDRSARQPLEVYRFLRQLGTCFLQFEPQCEPSLPGRVSPEAFAHFYCSVFDEWYTHDIGKVYIEMFDNTLAMLMGYPSSTCVFSDHCGSALALEANGDVFACDHFVPELHLGNMFSTPLLSLLSHPELRSLAEAKMPAAPSCLSCEYLRLCYGGCPRYRGEDGRHILCEGYKACFRHTLPRFRHMATVIRETNGGGASIVQ